MNTKKITTIAMLMAAAIVLTAFTKIPIPNGGGGYVHLGDVAIFLASVLTGPIGGFAVGGVASALADLLAGAPQFAVATLIVKGLMGLVTAFLADKTRVFCLRNLLAMIAGGLVMVAGYYLTYVIILYNGDFVKPLFSIWMDLAQFGTGVVLSAVVLGALEGIRKKKA